MIMTKPQYVASGFSRTITFLAVLLACVVAPIAQEREDRTLLSYDQMRAIINEASGERAMHHVLELVPYPRIRPTSEYTGHFRESDVMASFAKEYGYSTVEIESFPAPQRNWAPTTGELWMTAPESVKLFRSEERRVGKECRARWIREDDNTNN